MYDKFVSNNSTSKLLKETLSKMRQYYNKYTVTHNRLVFHVSSVIRLEELRRVTLVHTARQLLRHVHRLLLL
jgi:hypothetical protein